MSFYVLAIADDTQYNQGVEYWYRGDLAELMEVTQDNWSWMQEKAEYFIYRASLGKEENKMMNLIPENPREMIRD